MKFRMSCRGSFPNGHDTNARRRCSYSRSRSPRTRSYSLSSGQRAGASPGGRSKDLSNSSRHHVKTVSGLTISGQSQTHRETEHGQGMNLQAGPPEAPLHQLPLKAPSLTKKKSAMLRDFSLLQPNVRQTFTEPEVPISDEVLFSERHRTISQISMHSSDDMSLSFRSSQTNKSIAGGWSGEDGNHKYLAHKVAERNRRSEHDRKKNAIERLLPESSLDKSNNKWGSTKAGILEGAILVLDGLPMETKAEAVRNTLTKRKQAALVHECAETRAGRQCSGASNLIQTSSTN
ncbi:hypothetical protein JMJ35_003273 [Cladonia borealis]|uniref:Uncharacterized protein n=1 Tax=Cladonia borealis TaxID=184061 RepID=A0AA39R735_9LECA|nr:hypothetical protein JMJ35_003273 [Cladonia borealis]